MSGQDRAQCRVCGAGDLGWLTAREMMFGSGEAFGYRQCAACGCVQIAAYPEDIGRHYPASYYAHAVSAPAASPARPLARRLKAAAVNAAPALRQVFLAAPSTRRFLASRPVAALYVQHVPDPRARILDVGCGSGALLIELDMLHYTDLNGVDPFIPHDVWWGGRRLVRKAGLADVTAAFDCISFHHVLEHMPQQRRVLATARRKLAPGGVMIVRIPVVGGAAWRTYREHWVQLDPPRHFYLHSERSFRLLAAQAGLTVADLHYDSGAFQFWGSECSRRGIALTDPRCPGRPGAALFSAAEIAAYEARAQALNRIGDGDQIVAVLRAAGTAPDGE